ncbi:molybdopterin-dependent oxidoreductase [Novosphingobium colocasiae]|uniref:Molybdopterin-binding oxidoreductase n=1 Tax=Novosphingobium colocasiae TaxID=1256513 RepID=A0A918UFM4_9SPHN|nr:molybdopterin-dependent oxidoreductase [Novosphingobium colocasiae]GGZ00790.1 molybdopterin-binding oxidoreductase [Novosphingobium colocasiae]
MTASPGTAPQAGQSADIRVHGRICPFCEQNCATEVTFDHTAGKVVSIRGDKQDPLSQGFVCPKAVAVKDLHHASDVLTGPMIRRNGQFEPASWDEALDYAANRLQAIQAEHGRDAVGLFFGTSIAHIPGFAFYTGPLLNALQTRQIYSTSSIDCHPHFLAAMSMFGGFTSFPVPDIDRSDYFVLIGANPLQSNGSFMTAPGVPRRLKAIQERGGKVVVIDPRRTETARMADWYLSIEPGGDAALLLAIVRTLFDEGLVQPGHLTPFLKGVDALRAMAQDFAPERVGPAVGIPAEDIRTLAREIAAAPRACLYGRIGSAMQRFGSLTNWLINAINILTGNLDREGGPMFPQGVFEGVIMSDRCRDGQLPYDRWRSRVSNWPEMAGQFPAALMVEEMETPGEGQMRALVTMGANPALSSPNGGGRLSQAMSKLDFMLSFDIFINETTRHADVILPSPPHLSHSDFMVFFTFLTVRDYIKYAPPVFEAPSGALHDSEIICELIGRLTGQSAAAADDQALRMLVDQLRDQGNAVIAGLSFEQIVQHVGSEPGEDRMLDVLLRSGAYGDHFGDRPDGLTLERLKAMPHGVDFGAMEPRIDKVLHLPDGKIDLAPTVITDDLARLEAWVDGERDASLRLMGRRQVRTCNTWLHNFPSLAKGPELCVLLMHPADAAERGIPDGARVRVRSRTGTVEVPVHLSDEMRRGNVSLPHGWGHDEDVPGQLHAKARPGVNSNHLADHTLLDAPSGNVNLNEIPVEVELLATESA